MKMTVVIDTDDEEGIIDTLKIVNHFYRRTNVGMLKHGRGKMVRYGKIDFIKMLRDFARNVIETHEAGGDPVGLRFNKLYADKEFNKLGDFD